jgi:hypothetical protein
MSIVLLSRCKTNGSYILPAKYDSNYTNYGNKIDGIFNNILEATKYIFEKGNHINVYYICEPLSTKVSINQFNDCGNGYYVTRRYCILNGKWTRLCISTSKPHIKN